MTNGIKDELPPITTFLNRLLALTIELQNILFTAFEQLLTAASRARSHPAPTTSGWKRCAAESFVVTDRRTIYTHPGTGAETRLLTITQRERNRPVTLDDALDRLSDPRAVLLVNEPLGPRRRADSGPEPDARRRRDRAARPADPADGAAQRPLDDDGGKPLGRSRPRRLRRGLAGGACRGAGVHRQHDPHRGGLAAADLEAAAERVDPRLSAADRCRRAHHRPQGLARLGRERPCGRCARR